MGDSKGAISYSRPSGGRLGWLGHSARPALRPDVRPDQHGRGQVALVGFMDEDVARLPYEKQGQGGRAVGARWFGPEAGTPLDKDTFWGNEEFTMPRNAGRLHRHKNNGHSVYMQAYWEGRYT